MASTELCTRRPHDVLSHTACKMMVMMMTIGDDHPRGQVVAWNMDEKID